MAADEYKNYESLTKFFPELTVLQATQVCMLVFGHITIKDLADYRGVSEDTVKEAMSSVQKKLGVNSMKMLRPFVTSRVLLKLSLTVPDEKPHV